MAICRRLAAVRLFARALPPFAAPSLLNVTAAGFRVSGGSAGRGEPSKCSPMACSTTRRATDVKSRASGGDFRLLAREGMRQLSHDRPVPFSGSGVSCLQTDPLPYPPTWCSDMYKMVPCIALPDATLRNVSEGCYAPTQEHTHDDRADSMSKVCLCQ